MPRSARLARLVLWPLFVAASTAGFAFGFGRGELVTTLALVPIAQWLYLAAAEALWPADGRGPSWRDPEAGRDVFHAIVGQGVGNQIGATLVLSATALLAGWGGERLGAAGLWPAGWPFAAQALLFVAVADGLETLRHRVEHGLPLLWRVHALHHSVQRLHVLKAGRGHFLDMVLRHLVVFLPFAALGVPTEVMVWYPAAVGILGPIGHANLDVRLPGFLHKLLMTPQVHHIHHARAQALSMSNYANVFPFWDLLFGSFVDPRHAAPDGYGIEDDPMPRTLWGQLAAPFAWRRLTGGAASAR